MSEKGKYYGYAGTILRVNLTDKKIISYTEPILRFIQAKETKKRGKHSEKNTD